MSDGEEDAGSVGKQKSIFSGMGRVRQINQFREKWSPKPKSLLPDRSFPDAALSSTRGRRTSPRKYSLQAQAANGAASACSVDRSAKHHRALSIVDMERYLTINSWLEQNGIDISQTKAAGQRAAGDPVATSRGVELFDEVFDSLDVLEKAVESELARLGSPSLKPDACGTQQTSTSTSSPALFDYLAVVGPDTTDITMRSFWNQEEGVFEATVAFAYPPESQFNAESIEHFCFPSGIRSVNSAQDGKVVTRVDENFFVLMLSGGGAQGQSVQYALCVTRLVKLPRGGGNEHGIAVPVCYCLVSQFPFTQFFCALLQNLLDHSQSELASEGDCTSLSSVVTNKHAHFIDDVLQKVKAIALPERGCSMSTSVFPPPATPLTLGRPREETDADEKSTLLLQWSLPLLLSHLSIDRILEVLGFLLLEMKVIVISSELPLLSSATLALTSLLHPLVWAGPLISILPPFLHEYMEAPVPLVCGIDKPPRGFQCPQGASLVYLEDNRVQLHPADISQTCDLKMPGSDNLSRDLTRFTKQVMGREASSPEDKIVPFAIHVAIRRVRRHIEDLLKVCVRASEPNGGQRPSQQLEESEQRFVEAFMQTQMYQKYQDDRPSPVETEQEKHEEQQPSPAATTGRHAPKSTPSDNQHDSLKAAACVLFRIALTGSSSLQKDEAKTTVSADHQVDKAVSSGETLDDHEEQCAGSPMTNNPTSVSPHVTKTSPTSSTPTRKQSIPDTTEAGKALSSPETGSGALRFGAPRASSDSEDTWIQESDDVAGMNDASPLASCARRREKSCVWPLNRSDSDPSSVPGDSRTSSPDLPLRSARSELECLRLAEMFHSPQRSMTAKSDTGVGESVHSGSRRSFELSGLFQRADTDTTLSVFGNTVSEALGSADTEEAWFSEGFDEQAEYSQESRNNDAVWCNHEHESPTPKPKASLMQKEESADDKGLQRTHSCIKIQRSWRQRMSEKGNETAKDHQRELEGRISTRAFEPGSLTSDEMDVLTTGIGMDSRGAWDGWCEGVLFVSADLATISWERRAVSTSALSMAMTGVTGVSLKEVLVPQPSLPGGPTRQSVHIHLPSESIQFQYDQSSHHEAFFRALQKLVPLSQSGRAENPKVLARSRSLQPADTTTDECSNHDDKDRSSVTDLTSAFHFPVHKEAELERFKARLQRGFLLEKHGRLGKPHQRLLFSDAQCSCLMWKKPTADRSDEQELLATHRESRNNRQSFSFFQSKSVVVDSITAIVTGKQTSVFRRTVADRADDRLCLSVLTPTRTLDVRAYSEKDFQTLYRGFSALLIEVKATRDEAN